MTDAANVSFTRAFDRARLERAADWLAVAVVVALPWSTSAAWVFIGCWLLALVPTLSVDMLRREVMTWAGGLPVTPLYMSCVQNRIGSSDAVKVTALAGVAASMLAAMVASAAEDSNFLMTCSPHLLPIDCRPWEERRAPSRANVSADVKSSLIDR